MSLVSKLLILIIIISIIYIIKFSLKYEDTEEDYDDYNEDDDNDNDNDKDNDDDENDNCPDGFRGEYCLEEIWPIVYEYEFDKNNILLNKKFNNFNDALKKCDSENDCRYRRE